MLSCVHLIVEVRMSVEATPPLIAILDDEESVRVALDSLVRSAGYRSVAFESGLAFLAGFQKQEIGYLILDINMPEMKGLEVQRRLIEMNCSIPIICLSAHVDSELRERALKRGVFAVLAKILSGEALLRRNRVSFTVSGSLKLLSSAKGINSVWYRNADQLVARSVDIIRKGELE